MPLCPVTAAKTADKLSSWTIDVPSTVKGLPGSCVVIPCSFNYPNKENIGAHTGKWMNEKDEYIYHPDESQILKNYQNQTTLLGDLKEKNCSLKIENLEPTDQGPFYFRIEIIDHDKFSYVKNKVSIEMISKY